MFKSITFYLKVAQSYQDVATTSNFEECNTFITLCYIYNNEHCACCPRLFSLQTLFVRSSDGWYHQLQRLARKIQPELQSALGTEVRQGAIVMALKRMAPDYYYQVSKGIKGLLKKLGDFTLRSNMVVYTYSNSPTLLPKQKDVLSEIAKNPGAFYSFNQGIYESTIVASGILAEPICTLLCEEQLIKKKEHLASVSIILPQENVEISGCIISSLSSSLGKTSMSLK